MKFCRGCKLHVAEKDFGKNKSQEDGLHWDCKECARSAAKTNREKRKAQKLAEDERFKTLTPKQRRVAEELRRTPERIIVDFSAPKTQETCQTYVRKLRQQKNWMGSSFPHVTDRSLKVWEDRLKKLMTKDEYKQFIKGLGI